MKNISSIIKYVRPFWGFSMLNIIFNVLSTLFSLVTFILIIPFLGLLFGTIEHVSAPVDWAFNSESAIHNLQYFFSDYIERNSEVKALKVICICIIVFYFFKTLFFYLALFFMASIRSGVVRNIRDEIYEKIVILPISYFSKQKKGDIIARATNDVQQIEQSIMNSLQMFFREPFAIILFLTVLLIMSLKLTLFVLVLLPVTGYFIGRIAKMLRRKSKTAQEHMGSIISSIEESISGLRIIKAFNSINTANEKFRDINEKYTKLMIGIYRRGDLASPLSEFLGTIVMICIMLFGGRLVLGPQASFGPVEFITYLVLFSQLINPSKSISTAYSNIQKGIASVDRIKHILNAKEEIMEKPDAIPVKEFNKEIEFRNVSFKYEKEAVLDNINLKIPKGKTVALVGPSGAGKTTLADLLPRFYDCTQGDILIDGVSIKDYVINDLRNLSGIVTQETILFNDTVLYNIAFGKSTFSESEVINAAKVANAHEFIMNMENGYYTIIGDRGSKLSGGQRQRLSIARAVLKNPPLLILDEATSSLDTESERLVQDALYRLMKDRTSIVIAHRLSTIQFVDEIVVIEDGKIVEKGHHEQLLKRNGLYKKLTDMQSFS